MSPREPLPIRWMDSASEDMDNLADYLLEEGLSFEAVEDYVKRIYPFEIWHKAYEPLGMSAFHRNMRQGQEVYCNYILPENLPAYCPQNPFFSVLPD